MESLEYAARTGSERPITVGCLKASLMARALGGKACGVAHVWFLNNVETGVIAGATVALFGVGD